MFWHHVVVTKITIFLYSCDAVLYSIIWNAFAFLNKVKISDVYFVFCVRIVALLVKNDVCLNTTIVECQTGSENQDEMKFWATKIDQLCQLTVPSSDFNLLLISVDI